MVLVFKNCAVSVRIKSSLTASHSLKYKNTTLQIQNIFALNYNNSRVSLFAGLSCQHKTFSKVFDWNIVSKKIKCKTESNS